MDDPVWPDERAGWWRRTLALIVDSLCTTVPSIALGALLFALTDGYIQWNQPGLQWQTCAPVTSISGDLEPPPPSDSNMATVCRTSSVLGPIGFTLTVGRTTRNGGQTSTVSRSYGLHGSGQTGAYDVSWISYVALLVLLIAGESRYGITPGKRLVGIRVVAADDPLRRTVPLSRIAARYGLAIVGVLLPVGLALALILLPVVFGGAPSGFSILGGVLLIVAASAWQLWNVVRIVRRRPAVYDYIARVEVVRTPTAMTPASTPPGQA